jgi:hypothetical protein
VLGMMDTYREGRKGWLFENCVGNDGHVSWRTERLLEDCRARKN